MESLRTSFSNPFRRSSQSHVNNEISFENPPKIKSSLNYEPPIRRSLDNSLLTATQPKNQELALRNSTQSVLLGAEAGSNIFSNNSNIHDTKSLQQSLIPRGEIGIANDSTFNPSKSIALSRTGIAETLGVQRSVNLSNLINNNVSIDLSQEPEVLVSIAKTSTIELRSYANNWKLFQSIEQSDDLVRKFDEFIIELEQEQDIIIAAMKRPEGGLLVRMNISNILKTLSEIKNNFDILAKQSPFFLSKSKWKKILVSLSQTFRSKCNQLMTSVTLDILTQKEALPNADGLNMATVCGAYFGIGRPKNYKEAITKLGYLAEKFGNTDAMVLLAESYITGIGHGVIQGPKAEKNKEIGRQWLERAIEADNNIAKARLGILLITEAKTSYASDNVLKRLQDINISESHQRGRDLLLESAISGNVEAETALGILSYEEEDFTQAFKWFERAVAQGSPKAMNYLGLMYSHGDGVIRQPELAYQHFVTAANCGDEEACNNAAVCLERGHGTEKNHFDAMAMYLLGASRGSPQAMYSLGFLLLKKAIGMHDLVVAADGGLNTYRLSTSVTEANAYMQHVIEKNKSEVQLLIEMGIVTSKSCDVTTENIRIYGDVQIVANKGLYWMRRAVEEDILEASFQLGQVYEQGLAGVPVDLYSAFNQYSYAATRASPPHSRAALCAAHMLYAGCGVTQDIVKAGYFYEIAASAGIVDAMNALAILLEDGRCTQDGEPDSQAAAMWYLEASKQGSEQAAINLAFLLKRYSKSISFVNTRLGSSLTAHEVYSFLIKNYPSSKSIFQQQQSEYLHMIGSEEDQFYLSSKSTIETPIGNRLSSSSSSAKESAPRRHRYNDDIGDDESNVLVSVAKSNSKMSLSSASSEKKIKSSGALLPPTSLRGDLRGSHEAKQN